jgi:hypothetical protein
VHSIRVDAEATGKLRGVQAGHVVEKLDLMSVAPEKFA